MNAIRPAALLAAVTVLLSLVAIAPARADTPSSGGDIQIAQTLGDRDLTLLLRRVTAVPGPLRVDVITHAGTATGTFTLAVTPTGVSGSASSQPVAGTPTAHGTVTLGAVPGSYGATLPIDRAGPWELALGDGVRTARIPFVVPTQATSPAEYGVYGGFLAAGALLIVSVLVGVRARKGWWALVPASGVVAGLAVAITSAVLSASLPLPPQPGDQLDPSVSNATNPYALPRPLISDYSRPPAILSIPGAAPVAGRPADVTLDLTDGATGLPVDDVVVHDSALIHLLVVGPTGQLWHVHPIRLRPGVFQVHLTMPRTGHYAVSAELVRRGGGVQLVRSMTGIDVTTGPPGGDTAPPSPVLTGRPTTEMTSSTAVSVGATVAPAGSATTVTATFGTAADLQPWLGMLGHLIIAGPVPPGEPAGAAVQNAPVWAHAHSMGDLTPAMGSMAGMGDPSSAMTGMGGLMPVNGDSAADETVAAYGPDISFTYTFPEPGRYLVWIQAERNFRILTVPAVVDVPAAGARP